MGCIDDHDPTVNDVIDDHDATGPQGYIDDCDSAFMASIIYGIRNDSDLGVMASPMNKHKATSLQIHR